MIEISQYQKLVTTVVRRVMFHYRLAHLNLSEDDLIQEGMLALMRAARTFKEDGGAKFETYASRCIHNGIVDIVRREINQPSPIEAVVEIGDGHEWVEKREILMQALEECTEIERAIFNSFMQGYTYDEIAKIFEIGKKKIDNTIHKVKTKVRSNG